MALVETLLSQITDPALCDALSRELVERIPLTLAGGDR